MKHITIKRAEQTDVDMIMQLMQEAVDTVKVSDLFLPMRSWAFLLSIFRESQNIILDMI